MTVSASLSAALAALLCVLAPAARAEEPDFDKVARGLVERLRQGPRAAGRIGTWRDEPRQVWIDANTFRGPFGLMLDSSCVQWEGTKAGEYPAKFQSAVYEMHRKVQECAATRGLPSTVGLIYERMPQTRLRCDAKGCPNPDPTVHPAACASAAERRITWKDQSSYPSAATLFHELQHVTAHIDNQSTVDHNHPALHRLRDEAYFWEAHCFDQEGLLRTLRAEHERRLRAAKLSLSPPADLRKVYEAAFDSCAVPLRYQVRDHRIVFNAREIESFCRPYADYLMMEVNLKRQLTFGLMPLMTGCSARDPIRCPRSELRDPASAPAKAAAEAGILLPPDPAVYSPAEFTEWTWKACYKRYPNESESSPAFLLMDCSRSQRAKLDDPKVLEKLKAAGLSDEDVASLKAFNELAAAKAEAVGEGPGRWETFMEKGNGESAVKKFVPAVLARCARPDIKETSLCAELRADSSAIHLTVQLLLHWQPKTLPR